MNAVSSTARAINRILTYLRETSSKTLAFCSDYVRMTALITTLCFIWSSILAQGLFAMVEQRHDEAQISAAIDDFIIPYTAGRVSETYFTGSDTIVVTIQDLHCHAEVQRNIARILEKLDTEYGLSKIYMEGNPCGAINTSWISAISDSREQNAVLDALVGGGQLSGAEYFGITANRSSLLAGMEDEALYTANVQRQNVMMQRAADIQSAVPAAKERLRTLTENFFSARNQRLEHLIENNLSGKISTAKYYRNLFKLLESVNGNTSSYPGMQAMLQISDLQRTLNYRKISKEMQSYIASLKERLPYSAYSALMQKAKDPRNLDDLYSALARLSKTVHLDSDARYPSLQAFFTFIEKNQQMRVLDVVAEERRLIRALHRELSATNGEREVAFLKDSFALLEEYLNNKISSDDYAALRRNIPEIEILWAKYISTDRIPELAKYYDLFNTFYDVNIARNQSFIHNIFPGMPETEAPAPAPAQVIDGDQTKQMTTALKTAKNIIVVVSGGFHTKGINELLKQRNLSYVLITPQVTQDTRFSEQIYQFLMQQQAEIAHATLAVGSFERTLLNCGLDAALTTHVRAQAALAVANLALQSRKDHEPLTTTIQHLNKELTQRGLRGTIELIKDNGDGTAECQYSIHDEHYPLKYVPQLLLPSGNSTPITATPKTPKSATYHFDLLPLSGVLNMLSAFWNNDLKSWIKSIPSALARLKMGVRDAQESSLSFAATLYSVVIPALMVSTGISIDSISAVCPPIFFYSMSDDADQKPPAPTSSKIRELLDNLLSTADQLTGEEIFDDEFTGKTDIAESALPVDYEQYSARLVDALNDEMNEIVTLIDTALGDTTCSIDELTDIFRIVNLIDDPYRPYYTTSRRTLFTILARRVNIYTFDQQLKRLQELLNSDDTGSHAIAEKYIDWLESEVYHNKLLSDNINKLTLMLAETTIDCNHSISDLAKVIVYNFNNRNIIPDDLSQCLDIAKKSLSSSRIRTNDPKLYVYMESILAALSTMIENPDSKHQPITQYKNEIIIKQLHDLKNQFGKALYSTLLKPTNTNLIDAHKQYAIKALLKYAYDLSLNNDDRGAAIYDDIIKNSHKIEWYIIETAYDSLPSDPRWHNKRKLFLLNALLNPDQHAQEFAIRRLVHLKQTQHPPDIRYTIFVAGQNASPSDKEIEKRAREVFTEILSNPGNDLVQEYAEIESMLLEASKKREPFERKIFGLFSTPSDTFKMILLLLSAALILAPILNGTLDIAVFLASWGLQGTATSIAGTAGISVFGASILGFIAGVVTPDVEEVFTEASAPSIDDKQAIESIIKYAYLYDIPTKVDSAFALLQRRNAPAEAIIALAQKLVNDTDTKANVKMSAITSLGLYLDMQAPDTIRKEAIQLAFKFLMDTEITESDFNGGFAVMMMLLDLPITTDDVRKALSAISKISDWSYLETLSDTNVERFSTLMQILVVKYAITSNTELKDFIRARLLVLLRDYAARPYNVIDSNKPEISQDDQRAPEILTDLFLSKISLRNAVDQLVSLHESPNAWLPLIIVLIPCEVSMRHYEPDDIYYTIVQYAFAVNKDPDEMRRNVHIGLLRKLVSSSLIKRGTSAIIASLPSDNLGEDIKQILLTPSASISKSVNIPHPSLPRSKLSNTDVERMIHLSLGVSNHSWARKYTERKKGTQDTLPHKPLAELLHRNKPGEVLDVDMQHALLNLLYNYSKDDTTSDRRTEYTAEFDSLIALLEFDDAFVVLRTLGALEPQKFRNYIVEVLERLIKSKDTDAPQKLLLAMLLRQQGGDEHTSNAYENTIAPLINENKLGIDINQPDTYFLREIVKYKEYFDRLPWTLVSPHLTKYISNQKLLNDMFDSSFYTYASMVEAIIGPADTLRDDLISSEPSLLSAKPEAVDSFHNQFLTTLDLIRQITGSDGTITFVFSLFTETPAPDFDEQVEFIRTQPDKFTSMLGFEALRYLADQLDLNPTMTRELMEKVDQIALDKSYTALHREVTNYLESLPSNKAAISQPGGTSYHFDFLPLSGVLAMLSIFWNDDLKTWLTKGHSPLHRFNILTKSIVIKRIRYESFSLVRRAFTAAAIIVLMIDPVSAAGLTGVISNTAVVLPYIVFILFMAYLGHIFYANTRVRDEISAAVPFNNGQPPEYNNRLRNQLKHIASLIIGPDAPADRWFPHIRFIRIESNPELLPPTVPALSYDRRAPAHEFRVKGLHVILFALFIGVGYLFTNISFGQISLVLLFVTASIAILLTHYCRSQVDDAMNNIHKLPRMSDTPEKSEILHRLYELFVYYQSNNDALSQYADGLIRTIEDHHANTINKDYADLLAQLAVEIKQHIHIRVHFPFSNRFLIIHSKKNEHLFQTYQRVKERRDIALKYRQECDNRDKQFEIAAETVRSSLNLDYKIPTNNDYPYAFNHAQALVKALLQQAGNPDLSDQMRIHMLLTQLNIDHEILRNLYNGIQMMATNDGETLGDQLNTLLEFDQDLITDIKAYAKEHETLAHELNRSERITDKKSLQKALTHITRQINHRAHKKATLQLLKKIDSIIRIEDLDTYGEHLKSKANDLDISAFADAHMYSTGDSFFASADNTKWRTIERCFENLNNTNRKTILSFAEDSNVPEAFMLIDSCAKYVPDNVTILNDIYNALLDSPVESVRKIAHDHHADSDNQDFLINPDNNTATIHIDLPRMLRVILFAVGLGYLISVAISFFSSTPFLDALDSLYHWLQSILISSPDLPKILTGAGIGAAITIKPSDAKKVLDNLRKTHASPEKITTYALTLLKATQESVRTLGLDAIPADVTNSDTIMGIIQYIIRPAVMDSHTLETAKKTYSCSEVKKILTTAIDKTSMNKPLSTHEFNKAVDALQRIKTPDYILWWTLKHAAISAKSEEKRNSLLGSLVNRLIHAIVDLQKGIDSSNDAETKKSLCDERDEYLQILKLLINENGLSIPSLEETTGPNFTLTTVYKMLGEIACVDSADTNLASTVRILEVSSLVELLKHDTASVATMLATITEDDAEKGARLFRLIPSVFRPAVTEKLKTAQKDGSGITNIVLPPASPANMTHRKIIEQTPQPSPSPKKIARNAMLFVLPLEQIPLELLWHHTTAAGNSTTPTDHTTVFIKLLAGCLNRENSIKEILISTPEHDAGLRKAEIIFTDNSVLCYTITRSNNPVKEKNSVTVYASPSIKDNVIAARDKITAVLTKFPVGNIVDAIDQLDPANPSAYNKAVEDCIKTVHKSLNLPHPHLSQSHDGLTYLDIIAAAVKCSNPVTNLWGLYWMKRAAAIEQEQKTARAPLMRHLAASLEGSTIVFTSTIYDQSVIDFAKAFTQIDGVSICVIMPRTAPASELQEIEWSKARVGNQVTAVYAQKISGFNNNKFTALYYDRVDNTAPQETWPLAVLKLLRDNPDKAAENLQLGTSNLFDPSVVFAMHANDEYVIPNTYLDEFNTVLQKPVIIRYTLPLRNNTAVTAPEVSFHDMQIPGMAYDIIAGPTTSLFSLMQTAGRERDAKLRGALSRCNQASAVRIPWTNSADVRKNLSSVLHTDKIVLTVSNNMSSQELKINNGLADFITAAHDGSIPGIIENDVSTKNKESKLRRDVVIEYELFDGYDWDTVKNHVVAIVNSLEGEGDGITLDLNALSTMPSEADIIQLRHHIAQHNSLIQMELAVPDTVTMFQTPFCIEHDIQKVVRSSMEKPVTETDLRRFPDNVRYDLSGGDFTASQIDEKVAIINRCMESGKVATFSVAYDILVTGSAKTDDALHKTPFPESIQKIMQSLYHTRKSTDEFWHAEGAAAAEQQPLKRILPRMTDDEEKLLTNMRYMSYSTLNNLVRTSNSTASQYVWQQFMIKYPEIRSGIATILEPTEVRDRQAQQILEVAGYCKAISKRIIVENYLGTIETYKNPGNYHILYWTLQQMHKQGYSLPGRSSIVKTSAEHPAVAAVLARIQRQEHADDTYTAIQEALDKLYKENEFTLPSPETLAALLALLELVERREPTGNVKKQFFDASFRALEAMQQAA